MASGNERSRPMWFWPLVAFLIGLLVGWLVIGWAVWPVTYKNTLPQDLRAAERDAYLIMVAESYGTTGDADLAQERLVSWPADVLAADLNRLQIRLSEEDAGQAEQVRAMASALDLDLAAAPAGQLASAGPAGIGSLVSGFQWRTVCTWALWLLLVAFGAFAIYSLVRRWRATQVREAAPAVRSSTPAMPVEPEAADEEYEWSQASGRTPDEIAAEAKAGWPADEVEEEFAEGEEFELRGAEQPVKAAAVGTAAGRAAGAGVPSGVLTKVGEFRALYLMGEPDYDEAFDVKDSAGNYIGECGVALVDPVGRKHDQAAALQVWLWDKSDPDTKVKVLMGEGAYRDTALRDQLAKDHPALAVRPGATFELDSYDLLLRGTVEKLDYAESDPAYGVFAELQLLLEVHRKG